MDQTTSAICHAIGGLLKSTVAMKEAIDVSNHYIKERNILQEGDGAIAGEEKRELETLESSFTKEIPSHILHPDHPISLQMSGDEFVCFACSKQSPPNTHRYHCRDCDMHLHLACALSQDINNSWESQTTVRSFVHRHPVKLAKGTLPFVCSHCNGNGTTQYRYQCGGQCSEQMHLMCATNPAMIVSYLHPDHTLELKTRHYFKRCVVCHHHGATNSRVYTCSEGCDFFVHPDCAQLPQYYNDLPMHPGKDHVLVYREFPKHENSRPKCYACGRKCEDWRYTCYTCKGVDLHRECVDQRYFVAANPQTHQGNDGSWVETVEKDLKQCVKQASDALN